MDQLDPDVDREKQSEVKYEWYPPKAKSNLKKHGVSFEEARTVFRDARILDFPDTMHSEDELRYIGIGKSETGRILFVNFTMREETVRIISARTAESWERRLYEGANRHE
jgi:uncharacterized DUF497 family protein